MPMPIRPLRRQRRWAKTTTPFDYSRRGRRRPPQNPHRRRRPLKRRRLFLGTTASSSYRRGVAAGRRDRLRGRRQGGADVGRRSSGSVVARQDRASVANDLRRHGAGVGDGDDGRARTETNTAEGSPQRPKKRLIVEVPDGNQDGDNGRGGNGAAAAETSEEEEAIDATGRRRTVLSETCSYAALLGFEAAAAAAAAAASPADDAIRDNLPAFERLLATLVPRSSGLIDGSGEEDNDDGDSASTGTTAHKKRALVDLRAAVANDWIHTVRSAPLRPSI